MSLEILCLDSATGARTTPTCTNGKIDVNATVRDRKRTRLNSSHAP